MHLMCFGRLPYLGSDVLTEENEDVDKLKAEIKAWPGLDLDNQRDRSDLPDKLYRFLQTLLAIDPEDRPSSDEILHSIKAGASFYDHASTSPIKERKDSRAWPFPSGSASAQNTPTTLELRRRPSALLAQRNTEHNFEPNLNPSPRTQSPKAEVNSPSTLGTSTTGPFSLHRGRSPYNVPKLLPPPPPRRRDLVDKMAQSFSEYRIPFLVKSSILCFKVGMLLSGCSPTAPNPWIAYPLLALAVADLSNMSLYRSIILMVVHIAVVLVSLQKDSLCQ